jgi:hypothetical protein
MPLLKFYNPVTLRWEPVGGPASHAQSHTHGVAGDGTALAPVTVNASTSITVNGYKITGSGTAFPGSPTTNDRFLRTDIRGGIMFFWDGTRWLSEQQFTIMSYTLGIAADNTPVYHPVVTDYPVWVEYMDTATLTTGSAEWRVYVNIYSFDNAVVASLAYRSTSGETANKFYAHRTTIGTVVDGTGANSGANPRMWAVSFDEISGTAQLYAAVTVYYRLIAT